MIVGRKLLYAEQRNKESGLSFGDEGSTRVPSESGFTGSCEDSLKRLFFFFVNCPRVYFMLCPRQSLVSESCNRLLDITVGSLWIYLYFVSSWGFGLRPPLVLSCFSWFCK